MICSKHDPHFVSFDSFNNFDNFVQMWVAVTKGTKGTAAGITRTRIKWHPRLTGCGKSNN